MKLFLMSCGRLRGRTRMFIPTADKNEFAEAPMPVFLITHEKGHVLFDTGPDPKAFEDPTAVWGGLAKAFQPIGDHDSGVVRQLERTGCTPQDVKYVINSHLHFDHSGGNRYFPQATFLVSGKELECAARPELEGLGYFKNDWDRPLNYQEVEGEVDDYGDGRLIIVPTPGHTPGHQALLLRLEQQGTMILAADSVPLRQNLEQGVVSANNLDDETARQTLGQLGELAEAHGAALIYGHDSEQWETLKRAPECYC